MELAEFITNFAAQFDETAPELIQAETNFRDDLEEWDSLKALSIIAMVDAEYSVSIKGTDIRACQTVKDLFDLVSSKK